MEDTTFYFLVKAMTQLTDEKCNNSYRDMNLIEEHSDIWII